MKANDPKHPWARLTAAARTMTDDRDNAAPHGFATRVVALGFANEPRLTVSLFERFAWRAVGVAGLLAILSVVVNYSVLSRTVAVEEQITEEESMAQLLSVD